MGSVETNATKRLPPAAIDAAVETVFVKLAAGVSTGQQGALNRLKLLHQAIVDREEQGETLSRLLPGGLAEKIRDHGQRIGAGPKVLSRSFVALSRRCPRNKP